MMGSADPRGINNILRLGLVQMRSEVTARDENVKRALEYVDELAARGADLIVLPEFFNIEYIFHHRDYGYMDYAEREDGYTISAIKEKAAERGVIICATIYEEEDPGLYFDTAFLIGRAGETLGKYRKVHPAAVLSLEKIYFKGGTRFPNWRIDGFRIGVIICYDHFFPESSRCSALNGAEVILGPFAAPSEPFWEALMRVRAFENGVYLAPCNKVGLEGDRNFGGESMVVDPFGEVMEKASSQEEELLLVDVYREQIYAARRRYHLLRDRRPEAYAALASPDEVNRGLFT